MAGEARFTPTEADHIGACRLIFARSLRRASTWRGCLISAGFLGVCGAMLSVGEPTTSGKIALVLGLATWGAIAIPLCWGLNALMIPKKVRKLLRQQRIGLGEWRWRWDEGGFDNDSEQSFLRVRWDQLHGFAEGKAMLLFYLNDQKVLFLAKLALNPGQLDDLRATVGANAVPYR